MQTPDLATPLPAAVAAQKPTRRRYLTLLMIFVTVVICYVDRANLAVASAHIQKEFGISRTQMGYIFSAFAWTYTPSRFRAAGFWIGSAPGSPTLLP